MQIDNSLTILDIKKFSPYYIKLPNYAQIFSLFTKILCLEVSVS